jgi:glycosyltransferase involved in cell wall biosynthesis
MLNRNNKTVIHLADFSAPYSGNFIASLLALGTLLKKTGLRQVLIFPDRARNRPWLTELHKNNVPLHLLSMNTSIFKRAREIARIASKEKAVILHTHFTSFDVSVWLAGIFMSLKKKKPCAVWHMHSNFPIKQDIKRKLKDMLKLRFMGRSVAAIAVSEELKQSYATRGFAGKTHVVLNAIDVLKATRASKSKVELRRELKIPESKILLLSFGWDPVIKGIDLLIEAAKELSTETECTLLIVGTDRLKEFIQRQFGEIFPSWLKIVAPRECVADFYNAADIFISASRWEGWPYSVGEAMANGLPVISSNIPSLHWAHPAQGLIFFKSCDTEALGSAIKKVISWSPQKVHTLTLSNRELINTKFFVKTWANNIYNIYEELLEFKSK